MVKNLTGIAMTALVITGVGIALTHGAATASVIRSTLTGFAGVQRAAYGE